MRFTTLIPLCALTLAAATLKLPEDSPVKQTGPRVYRFIMDYTYCGTKGDIERRERVSAEQSITGSGNESEWKNVSVAAAPAADGPFGAPESRKFMNGFRYDLTRPEDAFKPEFFKTFPPMAMQERNLVWDAIMFETFARTPFSRFKLNEPESVTSAENIELAGSGNFKNRNIQLVWSGISERNGRKCALVDYRAFFNSLQIAAPGFKMVGRSNYWGQIWISLSTRQLEYATLYEDVLGETEIGDGTPHVVNVFRDGAFELESQ